MPSRHLLNFLLRLLLCFIDSHCISFLKAVDWDRLFIRGRYFLGIICRHFSLNRSLNRVSARHRVTTEGWLNNSWIFGDFFTSLISMLSWFGIKFRFNNGGFRSVTALYILLWSCYSLGIRSRLLISSGLRLLHNNNLNINIHWL